MLVPFNWFLTSVPWWPAWVKTFTDNWQTSKTWNWYGNMRERQEKQHIIETSGFNLRWRQHGLTANSLRLGSTVEGHRPNKIKRMDNQVQLLSTEFHVMPRTCGHVERCAHMSKQTCINARVYARDHRRDETYARFQHISRVCELLWFQNMSWKSHNLVWSGFVG